jgi:hypothetical protein
MPLANSTGPSWSKGVRDAVERRTSMRGMLARWFARLFRKPSAPAKSLPPPTPIESARRARTSIRSARSIVTGTERPDADD